MKTTRERRALPALALAGLLTLTACGSPSSGPSDAAEKGGNTSSPADPESPVSNTPDPGATLEPRGPRAVTPAPGQDGVHPIPFRNKKVNGRTVTLNFYSGVEPCNVLDSVDVEYGQDKIIVTLMEGHAPNSEDTACIELAEFKQVTIELDENPAGRKIVDGAK